MNEEEDIMSSEDDAVILTETAVQKEPSQDDVVSSEAVVVHDDSDQRNDEEANVTAERVKKLVAAFSPVLSIRLPKLYREWFYEDLDFKSLGFKKLTDFLESIPSIACVRSSDKNNITLVAKETTAGSCTMTLASTPPTTTPDAVPVFVETKDSAEDTTWLQPAIELWVGRALKVAEKLNKGNQGEPLPVKFFEVRLKKEAEKPNSKLRPNDFPTERTYVKAVVKGLRKDPRLYWRKDSHGILYWSSENKPSSLADPFSMDLNVIQSRILHLVNENFPLDVGKLPGAYKERYHEKLDYKAMGFKKLKALLDTMSQIEYQRSNSGPPLVIVLSEACATGEQLSDVRNPVVDAPIPVRTNDEENMNFVRPMERDFRVAGVDGDLSESGDPFVSAESESYGEPGHNLPVAFQSLYEFATKTNGASSRKTDGRLDDKEGCSESLMQSIGALFPPPLRTRSLSGSRLSVGHESAAASFQETAFLGYKLSNDNEAPKPVFLNTHIPFCMTAIGAEGSHALGCILESCLISTDTQNVTRLQKHMTALVLHYDQSATSACEAAGLLSPNLSLPLKCNVPRSKAVVLVSPTFYKQRKAIYGNHCTVRPLLLHWNSLTVDHIKRIMHIGQDDNQLDVSPLITLLRGYQRKGLMPDFTQFIAEVKQVCNIMGQAVLLGQRIALLESMVAESEVNKDTINESMDISKALPSDMNLIIVDLTDPLLSKEEANSLFQVVTEQFRSIPIEGRKLLALDKAHEFMDGVKSDGLSEAIVNVARHMRYDDGIRVAVSTQNPTALAPELLELVDITTLHHFHNQDWWTYLRQKIPVSDDAFEDLLTLPLGQAMLFVSRSSFESRLTRLCVRRRLTADFVPSHSKNY